MTKESSDEEVNALMRQVVNQLYTAIKTNNIADIEEIGEKYSFIYEDKDFRDSLVIYAAQQPNIKEVTFKTLAEYDINFFATQDNGNNCLHVALAYGHPQYI